MSWTEVLKSFTKELLFILMNSMAVVMGYTSFILYNLGYIYIAVLLGLYGMIHLMLGLTLFIVLINDYFCI